MITEKELIEAIDACHRVQNPTAPTCAKLASYYTILDHMKGPENETSYSYANKPTDVVSHDSGSEFFGLINGKPVDDVWDVLDEIMAVIQVTYPRLYKAIIRRLQY